MVLSLDASGTDEAIETLTIDVESASEGVIDFSDEGLNAETVTITGAGELLIGAAGEGMTSGTVNAADFTGDLTLVMGAEEMSATGGSGNDTFDAEGTLTFEDTIVGGDGTDFLTLAITTGALMSNTAGSGNVANVSGIETLVQSGAFTGAVTADIDQISRLTTLDLEGGGEDGATVTDLANNSTIKFGSAQDDAFTFDLKTNTTSDALTLDVEAAVTLADLDPANAFLNTLNIVADSNTTITNLTDISGASTVNISGEGTADIGTLATNMLSVDASAMTAALTVTASASSHEITSGSGVDTITGAEGANILDAGAGDDAINFELDTANGDTLTGGAGSDTFTSLETGATTIDVATITDFEFGTSTTTVDDLQIDHIALEELDDVIAVVDSSQNDVAGENGTVVQFASDGGTIADADLIVMGNATFADAAAMLAGLETGGTNTITYGADLEADDDAYLIAYSDGTDAFIAVATNSATESTTSNNIDAVVNVLTLEGVNLEGLANFDSGDFEFV